MTLMKWIQNKITNSMIVFSYIALELQTQIKVTFTQSHTLKNNDFLDKNDRLWFFDRNDDEAIF